MNSSWCERMNQAVDYIEANLAGAIDLAEIAKITCQPVAGFQRTFSTVTEVSVFEYIRKRKMTLAAFDMQNSNDKVVDVAAKYGYESPEAFARAFREIHGAAPTDARKQGLPLKAFPRITFLLSVKGVEAMDYRIEEKPAFKVYGIEGIFTTEAGRNLQDIPRFWQDCIEDGRFERLRRSTGAAYGGIHAVCDYRMMENNLFPYMLFVHHTDECNTDGYTEVEVPASMWAIFRSRNHTQEEMSVVTQDLIKCVYTDWMPTAAYNKVDGYELELYQGTDTGECYTETWIRVEPK